MSAARGLLLALLAALAGSAAAASACTVGALNLVFPSYESLRLTPTDTTGNIFVTCSGANGQKATVSIALSTGDSRDFSVRTMRRHGSDLNYNLYLNAARNEIWGDGNGGSHTLTDSFPLHPFGTTRNYPVYGRIYPRQNVRVGTYTDVITVTVSF